MCEMYGENAPQFVLQLTILLSKEKASSTQDLSYLILTNSAIVSSMLNLIKRATSTYLELAPREINGQPNHSYEPYTNWKNTLIVLVMMLITITPRILSFSIFFASCLPMFPVSDKMILGVQMGLIVIICAISIYAITTLTVYFVMRKKNEKKIMEYIDSSSVSYIAIEQEYFTEHLLFAITDLAGPCTIIQRKSNKLLISSIISVGFHVLLLIGLLIPLHIDANIWNESLHQSEAGYSQFLKYQVYLLLSWLCLSLLASYFLEKYGDLKWRFKLSKDLCFGDGEEFLYACVHGDTEHIAKLLRSGDKNVLNKVNQHGS